MLEVTVDTFLAQAAAQWQATSAAMFELILERGEIAESVALRADSRYLEWCESVGVSRQTANNYRVVYRHFSGLAPEIADQINAKALYKLAYIEDEDKRNLAMNWVIERIASGAIITERQAYIADPEKTPEYIRTLFNNGEISEADGYRLSIELGKAPEYIRELCTIYTVKHYAVVMFLSQAYADLKVNKSRRLIDIQEDNYQLVWITVHNAERCVSITDATAGDIEHYMNWRSYIRFETTKELQSKKHSEFYIDGSFEAKAENIDGKPMIALNLSQEALAAIQAGETIEISYKIKRVRNGETETETTNTIDSKARL